MRSKSITKNGVAVYINDNFYSDKCTRLTDNAYVYTFETGAVQFCSFRFTEPEDDAAVDNYITENGLIECDTDPRDDMRLWKKAVE